MIEERLGVQGRGGIEPKKKKKKKERMSILGYYSLHSQDSGGGGGGAGGVGVVMIVAVWCGNFVGERKIWNLHSVCTLTFCTLAHMPYCHMQ